MANPKKVVELGSSLLDNVINAFHGTPYKFDKFDINKIGSGEGAQVYGHGLYFAENPDTARAYRGLVPQDTINKIDDELRGIAGDLKQYETGEYGVYNDPAGYKLKSQYDDLLDQRQQVVNEARNPMIKINGKNITDMYSDLTSGRATSSDYEKADILEQIMIDGDAQGVISRQMEDPMYTDEAYSWFEKNVLPNMDRSGTLFEVKIDANKNQMLDWDKPIKDQPIIMDMIDKRLALDTGWGDYVNKLPDSVKGTAEDLLMGKIPAGTDEEFYAFKKLSEASPNLDHNIIFDVQKQLDLNPNMTGQEYYNSLARGGSDFSVHGRYDAPKASSLLDSFGVKGVKYLDQGSRDIGEGTSNFVLFGDKGINITNKYMNPATLIGSLGAGALATGSDRAMANPIGDLRASEAQFGMSPQERAIADLRASEAGFVPTSDPQWKPARFEGLANVTGAIRNSNPYKSFTSIGLNPLEGTMDYVDNLAWGQKNSPLDILFAGAELGGLGSMAKGVKAGSGLLNAFGADEKARNAILEGLLKEYGY